MEKTRNQTTQGNLTSLGVDTYPLDRRLVLAKHQQQIQYAGQHQSTRNAAPLKIESGILGQILAKIHSKVLWMRINRTLAWALVALPIPGLTGHMHFSKILAWGSITLFLHGVLSLILFGAPKSKSIARNWNILIFGFREKAMSPRNIFLLTGYRIMLGSLQFYALSTLWPTAMLLGMLTGFYMMPRLPISLLQHIIGASETAFRRARLARYATFLAIIIAVQYFLAYTANFLNFLRHG